MPTILTVNSGSSSLKASLFTGAGKRRDLRYENIGQGRFRDIGEAFDTLLKDLGGTVPDAVGHRFVHGGDIGDASRRLDADEVQRLRDISHLAPLHMPNNLLGVELCRERFDIPQVACFDTAFHATLPEAARRLPIPRELGLRRYGFHGLNYSHIARTLPGLIGGRARGRVVVAHLGAGASLCLMENLESADTTMGYTPAGGIPMGTRPGDLDPGVMLELSGRYGVAELTDLVYHHMGLLALSEGEGSEMSSLVESGSGPARFAVEYFCRQVRGAIGTLAARAGGIDALVFTGGIGEHSSRVRAMVCGPLAFLDFELDPEANRTHNTLLSAGHSKPILRIPADEESVIRDLTLRWIGG